jgi:hypothetical protein
VQLVSFILFVVGVGFVATYGWLNFNSRPPQVQIDGVQRDGQPAPKATDAPVGATTDAATTDTPTTGQKVKDDTDGK